LRVHIVGAGVAGSLLALLLERDGVEVRLYDLRAYYSKPCGEALPLAGLRLLEDAGVEKPRVKGWVRVFEFYSSSLRLLRVFESSEPIWAIIDKAGWVNRLREEVAVEVRPVRSPGRLRGDHGLVVDARGPFSSRGEKIVVWRAYADLALGEKAVMILDFKQLGLAWAFPYGSTANIGGGFQAIPNPREKAYGLLSRLLGSFEVFDEAYSMVTLKPRIALVRDGVLSVGEAAGFVQSLGGEGIRPAIESALNLYHAIVGGMEERSLEGVGVAERVAGEYRRLSSGLIREVKASSLLLSMLQRFTGMGERMLRNASDKLLQLWLTGRLRERARLAWSLASTLLRSLANTPPGRS